MSYLSSILFRIILLLLCTGPMATAVAAEAVDVDGEGCIWYKGYRRASTGRVVHQFVNACSEKRYITVCFEGEDGDFVDRTSSRKVQTGGRYEVYTEPYTRTPYDVWYASDEKEPLPAGPCEQVYFDEVE